MITLSYHAKQQARVKRIPEDAVLRAANDQSVEYQAFQGAPRNLRRRIRDGVVVIVDTRTEKVVTCYLHGVRTPLRPDQRQRGFAA